MSELKEGDLAPDFTIPSSEGESISLRDFKGKKSVVLYFYPKDSTPGCTIEACDFRDLKKEFAKQGAEILGVSFDNLKSHEKFKTNHKLSFPLLADEDKSLAKQYGVYKKKSLYGRSYMGIERTTFVINQDQKVAKIFPKVKVLGHAKEVLRTLKESTT